MGTWGVQRLPHLPALPVPPAEERFRVIFAHMLQVAVPIHFALATLFLVLGQTTLAWVNLGSIALHLTVRVLLRHGRGHQAFLLAVANLLLLFVTATLLMGWASGFHYYLLVLPLLFVLYPGWSRSVKAAACTGVAGAYGLLALHAYLGGRLVSHMAPGVDAFGIFNAVSFAVTMSVLSFIVGKTTADAENGLRHATVTLEELSNRDPLTGLLNRRAMEALLQAAHARLEVAGEPYAVALIDLDHFKRLNDSHGHSCGDAVLGAISGALQGAVRDSDHVARWGGEEFLVLLTNSSRSGADNAAHKMLEALRACRIDCLSADGIGGGATLLEPTFLGITATLGVAAGTPFRGAEATVRAADEALYQGKRAGRDRVVMEHPADVGAHAGAETIA